VVTWAKPRQLITRPTVSVVVPCYNYGRYLPDCLASALTQEGVDVDVLIVDDASPDGSATVARRLAEADSRVRVIENPVNLGHIATYNTGLRAVTGEYVVLLSADDLLAPGSLARAAALLERDPDMAFVYGYPAEFTDRPPVARTAVRSWTTWQGDEWLERICRRGSNLIFCPEVVMRGSIMRDLAGYEPDLPHSADLYVWMRAAARGAVGRVNGCDQAFYRVHGGNMHLNEYAGVFTDITERAKTFERFFAEDGDRLPNSRRLHDRARRSLAREAVNLARQSVGRGDPDLPAKLAAFAECTFPAVRASVLWRAYERQAERNDNGRPLTMAQRLRSVNDNLSARIRWRLWRRYGT
jgi:glycosyltransferase involved in cell wall biosynthesis